MSDLDVLDTTFQHQLILALGHEKIIGELARAWFKQTLDRD